MGIRIMEGLNIDEEKKIMAQSDWSTIVHFESIGLNGKDIIYLVRELFERAGSEEARQLAESLRKLAEEAKKKEV